MFALISGSIDFGRWAYIKGTIDDTTRRAVRQIVLKDNQASDCSALQAMAAAGNGITVSPDPKSKAGPANTDPSSSPDPTTSPPPGQGYAYIFPAAASGPQPPQPSVYCGGTPRAPGTVIVQITYSFIPITPVVGRLFGSSTIISTASALTEY